jgi:hypothetical protein
MLRCPDIVTTDPCKTFCGAASRMSRRKGQLAKSHRVAARVTVFSIKWLAIETRFHALPSHQCDIRLHSEP